MHLEEVEQKTAILAVFGCTGYVSVDFLLYSVRNGKTGENGKNGEFLVQR